MKKILALAVALISALTVNAQTDGNASFFKRGTLKTTAKSQTIPFRIWNDLIIVKAWVNGVEGDFILDNGFSVSGLDKNFAEKCKINRSGGNKAKAGDATNTSMELTTSEAETFSLGDFIVEKSPVYLIDIKTFIDSKKVKIDGLIGASVINLLNWKFDFDNNKATISTAKFEENGTRINFTILDNNIHTIPFHLNGYDFPAMVDLGYNSEDISANMQFAALFQGAKASEDYGISVIGASGASRIDTTYVIHDKLDYKLDNQNIDFQPKIYITNNEPNFKLGNRFFRHFNLIINVKDSSYVLSPRKKALPKFVDKSFGIKLIIRDNQLLVGKLSTNPNTKNGGEKLLEQVLSINGKMANDFDGMTDLLLYQQDLVDKNKKMKLVFKSGKSKTYTLQKDIVN